MTDRRETETNRKRVYAFLGLSHVAQLDRAKAAGVHEDGDLLRPDVEVRVDWMKRAKEKGTLDILLGVEVGETVTPPQTTNGLCEPNPYSSRVCGLGTAGCNLYHNGVEREVTPQPQRIFCGMCGDTGLQNGEKCPQLGCRKANGLPPFNEVTPQPASPFVQFAPHRIHGKATGKIVVGLGGIEFTVATEQEAISRSLSILLPEIDKLNELNQSKAQPASPSQLDVAKEWALENQYKFYGTERGHRGLDVPRILAAFHEYAQSAPVASTCPNCGKTLHVENGFAIGHFTDNGNGGKFECGPAQGEQAPRKLPLELSGLLDECRSGVEGNYRRMKRALKDAKGVLSRTALEGAIEQSEKTLRRIAEYLGETYEEPISYDPPSEVEGEQAGIDLARINRVLDMVLAADDAGVGTDMDPKFAALFQKAARECAALRGVQGERRIL